MTQTRIVNRPAQRLLSGEVELQGREPVDEHNLTIASRLEGSFAGRKEFGRWLDGLQSAVTPKKRRPSRTRAR